MPPNKNRENQMHKVDTFSNISKREEDLGKELSDIRAELKRVSLARSSKELDQIPYQDHKKKFEERFSGKVDKNTSKSDILRNELFKKDDEIHKLRSKNDELQFQFTNSNRCEIMSVLRDNHALKSSNKNLQIELSSSRNNVKSLKETAAYNQSQIKKLLSKNYEVEQLCKIKSNEIAKLTNEHKIMKAETEKNNILFKNTVAKLKLKDDAVSKELNNVIVMLSDTQKEQSETIEKFKKERMQDKAQIQNLLDMNKKIVKSRDNLKTSVEENTKELRFKIKHRDGKILKLEDLLSKSVEDNDSTIRSMMANEKKLREEIDIKEHNYNNEKKKIKTMNMKALTALNDCLKSKSEELAEMKAAEKKSSLVIKGLKHKNVEMKDETDFVSKVNEGLKEQLANQKHDKESNANKIIEEWKDKFTEVNVKLTSQIQMEEKLNHEINSISQDLATKDENLKKVQEESTQLNKVLHEELTAVRLQHDSSNKLNDDLKAQIKTLDQKLKMKEEKSEEKSKENDLMRSEIKALRESLSNEKIQCVRLMQLKENDDHQIGDLNKDLTKSKETIEKLEAEIVGLQNTSPLKRENKFSEISEEVEVDAKLVDDLKEGNSINQDKRSTIINSLKIKLDDVEATIADLRQQNTVKDRNIKHLKKKEKQYWSPRVESLSNNINLLNVKIEGDAKENENIHSSENLQLKSTINPEQSIIMTARSVLTEFFCLQDSSDETAFKDDSTGKRPSSDIQVNVEGKKKQKLK